MAKYISSFSLMFVMTFTFNIVSGQKALEKGSSMIFYGKNAYCEQVNFQYKKDFIQRDCSDNPSISATYIFKKCNFSFTGLDFKPSRIEVFVNGEMYEEIKLSTKSGDAGVARINPNHFSLMSDEFCIRLKFYVDNGHFEYYSNDFDKCYSIYGKGDTYNALRDTFVQPVRFECNTIEPFIKYNAFDSIAELQAYTCFEIDKFDSNTVNVTLEPKSFIILESDTFPIGLKNSLSHKSKWPLIYTGKKSCRWTTLTLKKTEEEFPGMGFVLNIHHLRKNIIRINKCGEKTTILASTKGGEKLLNVGLGSCKVE